MWQRQLKPAGLRDYGREGVIGVQVSSSASAGSCEYVQTGLVYAAMRGKAKPAIVNYSESLPQIYCFTPRCCYGILPPGVDPNTAADWGNCPDAFVRLGH